MTNKNCSQCYFRDKCFQNEICEDFYPISSRIEEEMIDEFIEEKRLEFYADWFEYIEENMY